MSTVIEVPSHFQPLLPFETKLLETLSRGNGEACRADTEDIALSKIRANFLRHLCTDSKVYDSMAVKEINIDGAYIERPLRLSNFEIKHFLRFTNCYIPDPIQLAGSKLLVLDLSGSSVERLEAPRLQVQYSLLLRKSTHGTDPQSKPFSAWKGIDLNGAVINGYLTCDGGQFKSENGTAIYAEHITIGNSFLLRGAGIRGSLNIMGATIGGSLECDGSLFQNSGGVTIIAENATVKGNVHLRKSDVAREELEAQKEDRFISEGEVRFNSARIAGNLDCHGASLRNGSKSVFTGDGMQVEGAVLFRDFLIAEGEVRFYGSEMGELDCTNGVFENPDGTCFNGAYMNVKNAFKWYKTSCKGKVSLYYAKVTHLIDTDWSWPQEHGMLDLDGFEYQTLESQAGIAQARLKWLALQFPKSDWKAALKRSVDRIYNRFQRDPSKRRKILLPYLPRIQPYEQLISVLNKMGWNEEARAVQIAKHQHITKYSTGPVRLGRWVKSLVDYGYSPAKALVPIVIIIAFGAWMFQQAAERQIITPTSTPVTIGETHYPYPDFDPILYSVDVFLPIVDLHQEDSWIPNTGKDGGEPYLYYMAFHIAAGWFLTTLFVAAVSGLVKTD
jgi:hypothetical protein